MMSHETRNTWQKPVGVTLHNLRREKRLTLREVATYVHVHYSDLSKLERGERPQITFGAIVKLANFYGVGLNDLLPWHEGLKKIP